jgi:hypothetical protein
VDPLTGLKHCTGCLVDKPLSEFYQNKRDGVYVAQCRDCERAYHRRYAAEHPPPDGYHRKKQLERDYGLTPEDVARMVDEQGGLCAGCAESLGEGKRRHVDHDHATGRVRGVLCQNCNMAVGLLHDNAATLRRLSEYLLRA